MPIAEIITIGTELLLGEIQDTNTRYLARNLRDFGIDIYRTMTVGDNAIRISQAVQESLERTQIIITTGGLGPTVDDPTRQAIALAIGVDLEFQPTLWDQIQSRFKRYGRIPGDNNKRQAYIPKGAIPVENPVGTAPAFIYEINDKSIISLPGVPHEMEYLTQNAVLPYLQKHYHLNGIIKATVLHTASIGESQVDELIGDLETISNPTVGLLAHPGQVDIRITAKASTIEEANRMISDVTSIIWKRLPTEIFGVDDESIEDVLLKMLAEKKWRLALIEAGTGGELIQRLSKSKSLCINGEVISSPLSEADLSNHVLELIHRFQTQLVLGVSLIPSGEKQDLILELSHPSGLYKMNPSYGGPPQYARSWAANLAIDFIRHHLSDT
jgi:nicotinamide-nucleotide amidase